MMERLNNWYFARSKREQFMLAIAAGILGLVLLVYGLLLPGMSAISRAERELDTAILLRGRIEARSAIAANAPRKAAVQSAAPANSQALQALVSESATTTGFEIAEIKASGAGSVSLSIASAKAGPLMAWISRLEAQGVELSDIRLRKTENGFVSAEIGLRSKG